MNIAVGGGRREARNNRLTPLYVGSAATTQPLSSTHPPLDCRDSIPKLDARRGWYSKPESCLIASTFLSSTFAKASPTLLASSIHQQCRPECPLIGRLCPRYSSSQLPCDQCHVRSNAGQSAPSSSQPQKHPVSTSPPRNCPKRHPLHMHWSEKHTQHHTELVSWPRRKG
jgi:hypothetical protein